MSSSTVTQGAPVIPLPQARREQQRPRRGLPDQDPCPKEPWDDQGAGQRFGELYRGRVRYVPVRKQWMVWDGSRWAVDKTGQVNRYATAVARKMLIWAAKVADSDQRKKALRAAEYTCQTGGHSSMLTMAGYLDWIATDPDDFDQHPDLLNCRNGVVDLRTGELRPHDPGLLLTMATGVNYRPGATHPDWADALTAIRPDTQDWFQTRVGQAATGHPPDDDAMLFSQGTGENGKSTVFVGVNAALGDYSRLISERALMADPKAHPTELMEFRGARFAFTEELPEGGRLNAARLKKVVGTSPMTARAIRGNSETWDATHSMFLGTNHLPVVDDTDWGTWRRLLLLDFPFKFLKPHQAPSGNPAERPGDPGLKPRIKHGRAQHEAVLAWIVEGAGRWYDAGRTMPAPPASVVADTEAWRAGSDLVLRYWRERLRADLEWCIWQRELYTDFAEWLTAHGHTAWSNRLFVDRFRAHDATTAAHLISKRAKSAGRPVSRRTGVSFPPALPVSIDVWIGVRFVTPDEESGD